MKNRMCRGALLLWAAAASIGLILLPGGVARADDAGSDGQAKLQKTSSGGEVSQLDIFAREAGAAFLDNQAALGQLKGWILDQPETAKSGYLEQINDAATLSTRILWYGDKNPFLVKILDKAASLGIKAEAEPRSMSLSQIGQATQKIWDNADRINRSGSVVTSIAGIGLEDNGLEVDGVWVGALTADSTGKVAQDVLVSRQALSAEVAKLSGARAFLIESDADVAATRSKDTSPFWAGGYMKNTSGGVCATGFSLKVVGMIQGLSGTVMTGSQCGSVHDAGTNKCSTTVLFSSTRTIARSFGATLITA